MFDGAVGDGVGGVGFAGSAGVFDGSGAGAGVGATVADATGVEGADVGDAGVDVPFVGSGVAEPQPMRVSAVKRASELNKDVRMASSQNNQPEDRGG